MRACHNRGGSTSAEESGDAPTNSCLPNSFSLWYKVLICIALLRKHWLHNAAKYVPWCRNFFLLMALPLAFNFLFSHLFLFCLYHERWRQICSGRLTLELRYICLFLTALCRRSSHVGSNNRAVAVILIQLPDF